MKPENLRILCQYSLQLVKIRQSNCKHLCTENNGAETLANVLEAYMGRPRKVTVSPERVT